MLSCKQFIAEVIFLLVPDYTKPFQKYIDVDDYKLWGVIQKGRKTLCLYKRNSDIAQKQKKITKKVL